MTAIDAFTEQPVYGPIPEESTAIVRAVVTDANGSPLTALDSLTVSLFDRLTGVVINGRNKQSLLNANGGVFDTVTSELTWTMAPKDNIIVEQRNEMEEHLAQIEFTYASGALGRYEIVLRVRNLARLNEAH